jgi:crotonobetainyl-CoA:carnitine CoA-transferase CaiB-like acyl-CoA transferase
MISVSYAGTRVIEIASALSAGVAGRCFADLGADVVRVEEIEKLPADPAERAVRTWARARKRVLAPRARGELGVGDIDALLAGADVVVTDLSPSRWYETFPPLEALVDAYPGLVVVDVTRFGRVGPYIEYLAPDLVVLALSGYLFMCGLNDREPLRLGVDLVDVMTGINAAGGAMLGLQHARRTGQGQVVEVSALRTMLCSTMSFATSYSSQGIIRRRSSTRMVSVGVMLPCKDGHALVNTFRTPSEILYVLLEDERLLDDRFADVIGRETHQKEMVEVMVEAAASRTVRQLFEAGQELRLQNAMVQSPLRTPSDPQHAVRRFFQPLMLEDGTTVPAPVPPLVPVEARDDRAHVSGETIAAVDSGTWRGEPIPRQVDASPSREALDGLKVLELTFAWAGPFMGRILADHGAQVVKIESRKYVDTAKGGADLVDRSFGENDRWMDRSTSYVVANPAKYHLGMELTDPVGREVLLDLVRWADVVIENFTPRVLPNLGLGWDVFRSANPSLIMISASGFGQHGPYRDYGAWGWGLECQSGITSTTGYAEDPSPFLFMPTVPDPLSATVGVAAILAALEERRRTGHGQWIDLSQYECATFATLVEILRAAEAGVDRQRTGNRHVWRAPQGVYPCQGADAWVAVAIESDEQWPRLCSVIGRRDLAADEQLRTHRGRYADRRIDDAISAWTRERSKHDAMDALQRAGVPAGAVQHAQDLHHDPQVRALEYFRAAWGSEIGLRIWPGTWYGMHATPGDIRRGTSTFGEDNVRVLRDLLGYGDDKVGALLATEAFSELQDGMERPATPGLSVATMLEQGTILSWDDDYRALPLQVAERNQRWRREHGLPEIRLDGRDD